MGHMKGRTVKKIQIPSQSVTEFELGYTAADIQQRRKEREARERKKEAQKQREDEATHSQEEGVTEKCTRTDKSDTETEVGGEADTSQLQSQS